MRPGAQEARVQAIAFEAPLAQAEDPAQAEDDPAALARVGNPPGGHGPPQIWQGGRRSPSGVFIQLL